MEKIINKTIESMEMPFTVSIVIDDDINFSYSSFEAVKKRIEGFLNQVDRDFSPFKRNSLVCKYQRGELSNLAFTPQFQAIFAYSMDAYDTTQGAFDPFFNHHYDPTGIVKGWAIQGAFHQFLQPLIDSNQIVAAAINGAGDIQMAVNSQYDYIWDIGIENPTNVTQLCWHYQLRNGAIATSGVSKRGAHITRQTNNSLVQATVVANNLMDADVYATTAISMGQLRFKKFAVIQGINGLMIDNRQNLIELKGEFSYA